MVPYFIWTVGWYFGVLGVAFEIHEMRLTSSYPENNELQL